MCEAIELLFGTVSGYGPRNRVLDGVQIAHGKKAVLVVLMP